MSELGTAEGRRYSAPALEKGLDILELLAAGQEGMTQSTIAARLGRSVSELFRMLAVLEQRGYIYRERPEDLYYLSLRMFELANRHPPTKRLLDVALPQMRALAETARQSVHLAVRSDQDLLIIAQIESPEPAGLTVRLGRRPLAATASGRVLMAFSRAGSATDPSGPAAHERGADSSAADAVRVASIAERGYEEVDDESLSGVTDISYPLTDLTGLAVAALTVPYLRRRGSQPSAARVRELVAAAARRICDRTHGTEL